MEKKFVIKEAWLLDENGNETVRLTFRDTDECFGNSADLDKVRGGKGKRRKTIMTIEDKLDLLGKE
jgi:hypothetical protein